MKVESCYKYFGILRFLFSVAPFIHICIIKYISLYVTESDCEYERVAVTVLFITMSELMTVVKEQLIEVCKQNSGYD